MVPQLRLGVIDHVVYMHLLRHSHLEGKRRLRFSIPWLAQNINLSTCPTREAVRRLAACGVLRLVDGASKAMWRRCGCRRRCAGACAGQSRGTGTRGGPESYHLRLRGGGFPEDVGTPQDHPRAGARAMLLLFAASRSTVGVPRPCRATGASGVQFVPQPCLGVHGMQRAERRASSGGVFALVVSRAPVGRGGTQRPIRGTRTACCRKAETGAAEWRGGRIIALVEAALQRGLLSLSFQAKRGSWTPLPSRRRASGMTVLLDGRHERHG